MISNNAFPFLYFNLQTPLATQQSIKLKKNLGEYLIMADGMMGEFALSITKATTKRKEADILVKGQSKHKWQWKFRERERERERERLPGL